MRLLIIAAALAVSPLSAASYAQDAPPAPIEKLTPPEADLYLDRYLQLMAQMTQALNAVTDEASETAAIDLHRDSASELSAWRKRLEVLNVHVALAADQRINEMRPYRDAYLEALLALSEKNPGAVEQILMAVADGEMPSFGL